MDVNGNMAAEIDELTLELVSDPIHNNQWNMDSSMTPKVSSYALLFSPEDGAELKYIPTQSINSINYAKIEAKNVERVRFNIGIRQHCVVC